MINVDPTTLRAERRTGRLARIAALGLVAAGVACAFWLRAEHVQWSAESLRVWILQWPMAPAAFVAVMVLRPFLLIPSLLLMTAGGALFGVVAGTLLGAIGGAISGVMMFWLARSLGRDFVERRLGARLARVDSYFHERGAKLVALYTAFPATPLSIAQVACGLSSIRILPFTIATLIGVLPRTALLAWFGDSLAQQQWRRAAAALVLIALAIMIGLAIRRRIAAPKA
ncbi:MAG: sulfurtransferase [Hydrocarboniphaga sp.]|uniref:TVP38/TMEM64 family protein n=1 Tax=Hydrocarboniphaga sp. TaxID=2033016 RepID=UPI00260B6D77|nr:VTT domain-containing protein [Hydrocarboniphaga sp.]MDB5971263.1 sulfurtransferase [Hydrocarboniphaga sp.]